ncbi:takeout-like [Asbolus verrucosus]|uniref:Takeout-like n=1 Tax=Asbolus verrucosus TaxID=1661398 RepID=A0A482W9W1_ASBVE|nr:takeout-like [Asbolus verrucosus]
MSVKIILVLVVLFYTDYSESKKSIPSYIDLCHRDDPNLGACVTKAVEKIQPHLRDGVPELFLPSMNPFIVLQADLDKGDSFKASFKNIEVYYADEFKIEDAKIDLDQLRIELAVSFSRLRIKSQYNIQGKILILQVNGQGLADGNFTNVYVKAVANGKFSSKNGKDYVVVNNRSLELDLGKPVFYFDNVFRNNPQLNEQTNKIVNENIVDLVDELKPVIIETVSEIVFASYIQKCRQSDPDVKHCYINAIEQIKSHFDQGVPEFSIPPMNPLVVPEVSLVNGGSFKATFKDIKIYHLQELKVLDIDIDLNNNQARVKLLLPKLRITSNYDITGKILFLQLNGNGSADGNLTNVSVDVELQGERYKKGGQEYIKFSSMEINEKLHQPVFRFEGLFRENPELTEQTNKVVNENIDEILDELRPAIHIAISEAVLGIIKPMFEKFSVKELFPE